MALSLGFIVETLGGELIGSADRQVQRLAPLQSAGPDDISFLSHARYRAQLQTSQAGAVILAPAMQEAAASRPACILTADPYLYFSRLTRLWRQQHPLPAGPRIHPSAVVDPSARIAPDAVIGPLCVIEAGAQVGAGTVLHSRVTVGHGCRIGQRCIVHAGVVIGADGFGFAPHQGRWEKIEQLGAVRIGNDVELGANTCVDRGALDDTVIEDGVKLDNLVQIAHNVHIGEHSAMAGCVGVAGSARIGKHCTVGGAGMILGHLTLADHVHVSSGTLISRSILKPGQYSGVFPFDDNASWEKNAATLRQLHALRDRIRALEKEVKS